MGIWESLGKDITDSSGFFHFEINKSGPYEVRWINSSMAHHQFTTGSAIAKEPLVIKTDLHPKSPPPWMRP